MLKIVRVLKANDKKNLLKRFNPESEIWVVSDLKTKLFLKSLLLETHPIIFNEPIKRPAELWALWLQTNFPQFSTVGNVGSWALAKKYLEKQNLKAWLERPGAATTLIDSCKQLTPFITHDLASEFLADLQSELSNKNLFFEELVDLGIGFYEFCLNEKRLPYFFIPSFLMSHPELLPKNKTIYFDLGAELLHSERDLINELSRENIITVFVPSDLSENRVYKNLGMGVEQKEESVLGEKSGEVKACEVWKCASMDSEARKAVEKISQWIALGLKSAEICVVAHDISFYENILSHDLSWQGLGLNRQLSSPAAGIHFFRQINARLKISCGSWDSTDLAEAFPEMSSRDLKMLKPVMNSSQIYIPAIQNKVRHLEKMVVGNMVYEKFQNHVLKITDDIVLSTEEEKLQANTLLLNIFQKLQIEVSFDLELSLKTWVEVWQRIVSSTDYVYKKADPQGVWAVNARSIEEIPAKNFIFLGMNVQATDKNYCSELSRETQLFIKNLGFDLQSDPVQWDDHLDWYLGGKAAEVVFSHAASDASGKTLSPSETWLIASKTVDKDFEVCDAAANLVWLDVQKDIQNASVQAEIEKLKSWPQKHLGAVFESLRNELEETKKAIVKIDKEKNLSASALEQMWTCPFKFLAAHGMRLRDEEGLEVEPTPMHRGLLLHAAAEEILKAGLDHWNEESLTDLINQLGEKQKEVASDVWPSTCSRILRQVQRFIEYEKAWKNKFPLSTASGFEVGVNGYISWREDKLEFSNIPLDNSWKFKGKIDRIDVDHQERAVLLDYKDKVAQLTNVTSWQKNGQFQLALYSQAVQKGLTEVKVKDVVGSFYYSLKNLKRDQGFVRSDLDLVQVLPEEFPKNAKVDDKSLQIFFEEINFEVGQCLNKISEGDLTPQPRKESFCETCSWNNLCRSHHLL